MRHLVGLRFQHDSEGQVSVEVPRIAGGRNFDDAACRRWSGARQGALYRALIRHDCARDNNLAAGDTEGPESLRIVQMPDFLSSVQGETPNNILNVSLRK